MPLHTHAQLPTTPLHCKCIAIPVLVANEDQIMSIPTSKSTQYAFQIINHFRNFL